MLDLFLTHQGVPRETERAHTVNFEESIYLVLRVPRETSTDSRKPGCTAGSSASCIGDRAVKCADECGVLSTNPGIASPQVAGAIAVT